MKRISGLLREEFFRVFDLKNIILTLVFSEMILVVASLNWWKVFSYQGFRLCSLYTEIFNGAFMAELVIIPVSAFVTYAFYIDLRENWSCLLVSRGNLKSYIAAKIVNGTLYAGSMMFLSISLYEILLFGCAFVANGEIGMVSDTDAYADLFEKSILSYFMQRNVLMAVSGMLTVLLGILITVVVMNRYISYIAAFIAYVFWDNIITVTGLFRGEHFNRLMAGVTRYSESIPMTIVLLLLKVVFGLLIIGNVIYFMVKWRYYDGKSQ